MFLICLSLSCVLLPYSAGEHSLLTPEQKSYLADAQAAAVEQSKKTEQQLLNDFASFRFKREVLAQGYRAWKLLLKSPAELLWDLKNALHSMDYVFSFGYDAESAKLHPGQPAWSLKSVDEFGHIPTLWELKADGKANALPEAQWELVDAEETGLYRLPNFAKPHDPNMTEAALRPSYVSGNLAHFDAGIWEFGLYAPMYRQSVLKERAVIAGLDGGGWTTVCNSSASSMNKGLLPIITKMVVPCDAIFAGGDKKVIYGTVDHLLHAFYANTRTFNVMGESLARRMYQLLIPGASMHPLEDNMYMEAVFFGPARMQDMKLFIVSFPDVFGTPEADAVRDFCKRHKLPLAWAFGSGKLRKDIDMSHKLIWAPYEPFVHWNVNGDRLLDPSSWTSVNSAALGDGDWEAIEVEAHKTRKLHPTKLTHATISSWWNALYAKGGIIRGLRGRDCKNQLDLCFGTSGDKPSEGKCLCRVMNMTAESELLLV